ncbi:MAG: hypothetical protein JRG97_03845 [Deltaproteobacteria bacterium]|nr:hypothetical protein [Deltaproteobacteria bacterium]MBW2050868.1 hypothetical protein [Deltaproteobacteria bacterium]MBW2140188.1 hypothetical protein [Deltaproteobacteria bacterium]MBW2322685.1 hypothetical protein [Deltaproteobacteria bacterium]
MRGDRIVRIIALVLLCALVYYFSYDQGKRAYKPRVDKLEQALSAKEKVIEALALEIRLQKKKAARLEEQLTKGGQAEEKKSTVQPSTRVTIRLGSSRTLLDQRLVVACLEINREAKKAKLQFNFVQENRVEPVLVKVGQSVAFNLADQKYIVILDQIYTASVSLQIIKQS